MLSPRFARLALLAFLAATPTHAQDSSRGEYLAVAGNCVVCHTISEGAPYAGGLKMMTPLGAIYSTNITPDPETGIGKYSLEEFERAVRSGVARDGRRLYPAMPYPSYARLSDEDIRALFEYFSKDVAPVRQKDTPAEIRSPWDQRWPLVAWNFVGAGAPFRPDTSFDDEWNRGAYLVQGLGHCGACHTPRGWLFQEKGLDERSGAFLAGGELDNWSAPNLRGDLNSGLGRWTRDEIAEYLKTGRNRHGSAFGAMRDVVVYSTSRLDDADIAAMAKYIKSLSPSIDRTRPVWVPDGRAAADLMARRHNAPGSATYARQCMSCHGADGAGSGGLPALAGNAAILDPDPTSLVNIVLNGAPALEDGGDSREAMPQYRTMLKDSEIADVVSFIRSAWGNRATPVAAKIVEALRQATVAGGERTIIRQMR